MLFARWRARRSNNLLIERIHAKIVAGARRAELYQDFAVPDRLEGRFEMTALHAGLVMRRLALIPNIGADMAQDLADSVFAHFDAAFREIGIGDTVVPKRMKRLAEAFYGCNKAYAAALTASDQDALARSLARNVYGAATLEQAPMAQALALAVSAMADALRSQPDATIESGDFEFATLPRPAHQASMK